MKTFNLIFTLLFLFVSFSNADVLGTKTQGPALIEGFNEIASAAGTTTLTKDSQTKQILTGTSTQTFVLPDATTIPLSRRFLIINKSTGTATIQTSGGGALTIISAGLQKEFHLRAAGSAAGTWDVLDGGGGGGAWGGITGTLSDQTDLQTALNAKAPTASPTFTGTIGTPLTASMALVTDASGNLSASSTTSTALGYLDVSSSLTTLLAAKAPTASPTFTGTIGTPLTASKLLATDASGNLTATAANSSQASYLDLTSSAQTQLNGKLSTSNYSAKGDLVAGVSSGVVAGVSVGSNGKVLVADSGATAGLRWDNATPKKNYVTNWNAEGGVTTGWSTYVDAAGTQPVDCTGGAPNSTWAASASSAIHDSNNFLATLNTGATRKGEGVSYAFTTDSGDSPAMMSIRFYYKVAGGTFAAGNDADRTSAGDSDFTVWIYDVTKGTLIQPSTYRLYSNSTTVAEPFVSNFQTNSNSTSYRLCIHKGTSTSVSGTNITVRFDDFEISRSTIAYGTPISDWVSYTPTITGFGTPSNVSFKSRRVGDSLEVKGYFTTGTNTASQAQITLGYGGANANVTIDTTKIQTGSLIGNVINSGSGATYFGAYAIAPSSAQNYFNISVQTSTTGALTAVNGNSFANGSNMSVELSVPITGWSSSTQVSDGYDGRQIAAHAHKNASDQTGVNPNASFVKITFGSTASSGGGYDQTASFDTTNSKFTAPSSGKYSVKSNITLLATNILANEYGLVLYKNGSFYKVLDDRTQASTTVLNLQGSTTLDLVAGDYLELYLYGNGNNSASTLTIAGNVKNTWFAIEKLSSPTTMSATEVVAASYTTAAGQSIPNTSTDIIDFGTKDFDTHNAVTTGSSWKFTAPISGLYEVSSTILFASSAVTQGNAIDLQVFKNGTVAKRLGYKTIETTFSNFIGHQGSAMVQLNAGDYIDVRVGFNRTGGNTNLHNSASYNHVSIHRIK